MTKLYICQGPVTPFFASMAALLISQRFCADRQIIEVDNASI